MDEPVTSAVTARLPGVRAATVGLPVGGRRPIRVRTPRGPPAAAPRAHRRGVGRVRPPAAEAGLDAIPGTPDMVLAGSTPVRLPRAVRGPDALPETPSHVVRHVVARRPRAIETAPFPVVVRPHAVTPGQVAGLDIVRPVETPIDVGRQAVTGTRPNHACGPPPSVKTVGLVGRADIHRPARGLYIWLAPCDYLRNKHD